MTTTTTTRETHPRETEREYLHPSTSGHTHTRIHRQSTRTDGARIYRKASSGCVCASSICTRPVMAEFCRVTLWMASILVTGGRRAGRRALRLLISGWQELHGSVQPSVQQNYTDTYSVQHTETYRRMATKADRINESDWPEFKGVCESRSIYRRGFPIGRKASRN